MPAQERRTKRKIEQVTEAKPSFAKMFVNWHEGLARVGVEQQIIFGEIKPDELKRQMLRDEPDHAKIDFGIPLPLWTSESMQTTRQALAGVYDQADAFFKSPGITYQDRGKVYKGKDGKLEDDTYNEHGARASFFAFKYLGVTDPLIHAMLRFHDYKNFFKDNPTKANETLTKHIRALIVQNILPNNALEVIASLDKDDERTHAAAKKVSEDEDIPIEFRKGTEHTPESLWKLYEQVTIKHTATRLDTTDRYLSPVAIFGTGTKTTADEYRKHVAKIALAYEKYAHPKEDTSKQQTQADALMVLMELWPVARGLDEGILSRYAGDCMAMAFMPDSFKMLGQVVERMFPADALEDQRSQHSKWLLSHLSKHLPTLTTYLSPLEMLQREYKKLGGKIPKHQVYDVAIPGSVTKASNGDLIDEHIIDVKSRSSVFWKMLERWNDRKKKEALPRAVQALKFGSEEFWEWALSCHHDIFRSQIVFLGNGFFRTDIDKLLDPMKREVLSDGNVAEIMYPDNRDTELVEEKEGDGLRANLIYRQQGGIGNMEIQVKDETAYDETVHGDGMLDHIGYKLRHVIKFLKLNEQTKNSIVWGGHQMRKRHLEMTYMFLDENNGQVQHGTVYAGQRAQRARRIRH